MTAHSPTPWRFGAPHYKCIKDHGPGPFNGHGPGSVGGCDYQFQEWLEDSDTISSEPARKVVVGFDDGSDHTDADAEFILRAVNCHDELLEVLKAFRAMSHSLTLISEADAIIAKAEAK